MQGDAGEREPDQPVEPVNPNEQVEVEKSEEMKAEEQGNPEQLVEAGTAQQTAAVSDQVTGQEGEGAAHVANDEPFQGENVLQDKPTKSSQGNEREGEEMEVEEHGPLTMEDNVTSEVRGAEEVGAGQAADSQMGGAATTDMETGDDKVGGAEMGGVTLTSDDVGRSTGGELIGESAVREAQPSKTSLADEQPRPLMDIKPHPLLETQPRPLTEANVLQPTSDYYSASDVAKEEVSMATDDAKAADQTATESKEVCYPMKVGV